MIIFLLVAAISAFSHAQNDCSHGACYPPSGDLLLGRAQQLHASSTCGLTGSEVYCTPYQQRRMKCCPCDSRNPNSPLAHTVQEVLSSSGPDRWWQSRKDMSPVTLELDLDDLFQLDTMLLTFKGPRPSSFIIERTQDNGRTWQPSLFFSTDCQRSFPGISTATPLTLDDTYCYTLPPVTAQPYQDYKIQFSPLRQYSYIPASHSQKVEEVTGLTGLRLRMMELGDVPRLPGRALSRFFALREMKVLGSCMCHGHANQCLPTYSDPSTNSIQVNPQCVCQHNTAGVNCERCADLYNDLPWRPAEDSNPNACQRCECNNHAQRCHFDPAVYEASGHRSGGVCEACMHHTTGPKCNQCAPGYQPNPHSRMDRPDACIRCVCSAEGTVNEGRCDDSTGSCQCKVNVEGPRCDRCKRGYYGLSASNPLGCSKCSCSAEGSRSEVCDPVTGQCPCHPHFHGLTCEVCSKGYWKPQLSHLCKPCSCDPTRSYGDTCDQLTGQCQCRPGFGGRTCTECTDGTFGDPLLGCRPCQCDIKGTLPGICDKQTGACMCRPGVTGSRCDSCSSGHCDSFPNCETCPSCYFTLDAHRQNLSSTLGRLSSSFPSCPRGACSSDFSLHILTLQNSLDLIQDSITLPSKTARDVDKALVQLDTLRDEMDKINKDLSPLDRNPGLDSELDKLRALVDRLTREYKAKKDASEKSISPNNTGAFSTIQKAYNESTDAAKKVEDTVTSVKESADVREETKDLQNQVQPANTRDLDQLNQNLASRPDLTPVAKQVCGSVRSEPCTPMQCEGGDLCPPDGAPPCTKGGKCVGALPLGKRADADAKDVKDRLEKLTGKITEAAEKLQKTQETTDQVRQSTDKLSNKMKQARDELEDDLKEARDVVKELKDFLSDPASNLSHIQEVSDWILKAKLPLSLATLKRKLDELKNMAANLPDSSAVLSEAEPQLDAARKLLQGAKDARDTALGVKDDVDGLLSGFGSVEGTLSDLEEKLDNSMDLIDNVNNSLNAAKDKLSPAEEVLDDVSKLIQPMKPQLDELKDLLENGRQKALEANDNADDAQDEADSANEDLLSLAQQLDHLKNKVPSTGSGPEEGPVGDRLATLMQDAGDLANTTENMLKDLEGKGETLRSLQKEVVEKSSKLEGLDTTLQGLLERIRKKAHDLSTCQG